MRWGRGSGFDKRRKSTVQAGELLTVQGGALVTEKARVEVECVWGARSGVGDSYGIKAMLVCSQ